MSERCATGKTPQGKANATDKFNSIARHNQRHCLFENAATTIQAIFSAVFNSLLGGNSICTENVINFFLPLYHYVALSVGIIGENWDVW